MPPVLWARVIPWDKEVAVAALESGVETLWIPDGRLADARELGRVTGVCAEGDLREGRDFRVTAIERKEDESAILASPPDLLWVVAPRRGEVIPLENLVARRRKVLVTAGTPEEAVRGAERYRSLREHGPPSRDDVVGRGHRDRNQVVQ